MTDDHAQATEFDAEEAGCHYAHELINALIQNCHTTAAFIQARAEAWRSLLAVLDGVDPTEIIEAARQDALPDEIQRRTTSESDERRKERGSEQDPLYPPK